MLQRTNIYLDSQLITFLKRKAKQEKTTMSDVVRRALKKEREKDKSNWIDSMLALSKKAGKSKYKDLATRHDYYLYGKGRI